MSDRMTKPQQEKLEFEYDLDAAPEKVWRAISSAEHREKWLPKKTLADDAPLSAKPGREIRYRMRDDEPPFLESIVTFLIAPNPDGGTRLKIIHELADQRVEARSPAANSNNPPMMRAA